MATTRRSQDLNAAGQHGHGAAKPLAASMKGKIASRAHSFKENLLEALGHHSHHSHHNAHHVSGNGALNSSVDGASPAASSPNGSAASGSHGRPSIQLAKKTNSTDNLIGYSEPRQSTDALVRDVQLSLRYFQDAVSKGTFELLPGCASIVLERVVAIQAFAFHDRPALREDARAAEAMDKLYAAVSALVKWADSVIVTGTVDAADDAFVETVVEPVRKSVIVLVNRLAQLSTDGGGGGGALLRGKAAGLHNSLPDISDSQQDLSQCAEEMPPKLPKRHHHRHHHHQHHHHRHHQHHQRRHSRKQPQQSSQDSPSAPPLPPKLTGRQPAISLADPTMYGHADWFANPLFEGSSIKSSSRPTSAKTPLYETSFLGEVRPPRSPPQKQQHPKARRHLLTKAFTIDSGDRNSTSDHFNFPYMDEAASPSDAGKDNVFFGESAPEEAPPALPRKEVRRKRSQYDNVWEGPPGGATAGGNGGSTNYSSGGSNASTTPSYLTSSQSFDFGRNGGSVKPAAAASATQVDPVLKRPVVLLDDDHRRLSDGGAGGAAAPPPLPPKKRDIINYMEILGQSLLPRREDLMQSLAQTQMLLRNVWADNYHQFGEFVPVDNNVFNHFPAAPDLFTRNVDLSMLEHDHQLLRLPDFSDESSSSLFRPAASLGAHPDRHPQLSNTPPALPPKRNRASASGLRGQRSLRNTASSSSKKERIIPIVRESDGSVISPDTTRQEQWQQHKQQQQWQHLNNSSLSKRLSIESAETASSSSAYSAADAEMSEGRPDSVASSGTDQASPGFPTRSLPTAKPPTIVSASQQQQQQKQTLTTKRAVSPEASSKKASPVRDEPDDDIVADSALNRLIGEEKPAQLRSLIYASNSEGILELRAGDRDELVVLATQTTNRDFVYQDAFLLTYRTFLPTMALLRRLQHRFRRFNNKDDPLQLRAARSAFSLLVRVVDSLIDCDLNSPSVSDNLSSFISELVERGDLLLARALRTKFIQRYEEHRGKNLPELVDLGRLSVASQREPTQSILHFKSSELAEQITLMDHANFLRLEPGELLLWVKEQNEERSPNLVKFTKHFNAMSFWCRTCLLTETDTKEREKLANKFIKVMKYLRKHNNFNSYLAFLSALDSASIRRLDWPKSFVDVIAEFSAIIDFSGSFKAYREALAHASPPLIPYMGLVLQDLTFVHIGNSDTVKGGKVNFAKRWQQYNILDNVRRFKRAHYSFSRRDDIARCFGNFENALSENQLWELSERIKPRATSSSFDHLATSTLEAGDEHAGGGGGRT